MPQRKENIEGEKHAQNTDAQFFEGGIDAEILCDLSGVSGSSDSEACCELPWPVRRKEDQRARHGDPGENTDVEDHRIGAVEYGVDEKDVQARAFPEQKRCAHKVQADGKIT